MSATHDCPIEGCAATGLPMSILMCKAHWAEVPRDLQRAVYRAWRHGGVAEHAQAREDAIAHVEGREPEELFA